jgi:WD40 repeat protein
MDTSGDGAWMAIAGGHRLRLLRLSDQERLWETDIRGICRFDFSPDQQWLVALDAESLRCFETISGKVRWRVPRGDSYVRIGDVACSADGRWIAAPLDRHDVSLVQATTGRVALRLANPSQVAVASCVFSGNGRYLAITLADQSALLWNLQTLREELGKLELDWQQN